MSWGCWKGERALSSTALWQRYYEGTIGLVYVIDVDSIAEAGEALVGLVLMKKLLTQFTCGSSSTQPCTTCKIILVLATSSSTTPTSTADIEALNICIREAVGDKDVSTNVQVVTLENSGLVKGLSHMTSFLRKSAGIEIDFHASI